MSGSAIQLTEQDGIGILTFDQPQSKVNVLSTPFWNELAAALTPLEKKSLKGLILRSAKPGIFIAGADLKELANASPSDPTPTRRFLEQGQAVLNQLEALPYPTVALLEGAALGGGLEVALACDYRVCVMNTQVKIGFPEVKLGLIPGWGGTQRLPRLMDMEEAINRLLSGESYDSSDPPPEDLVDATTEEGDGFALAKQVLSVGDWLDVREMKTNPLPPEYFPTVEFATEMGETLDVLDDIMKPAAFELLKVVLQGAMLPLQEGIKLETEAFLRLAGTPESKTLIERFFARKKG
jgi:enoyl-CoA hydratase